MMTHQKTTLVDYIYACGALLALVVSTCCFVLPVFILGLLKCIPIRPLRVGCTYLVDKIAILWIGINNTYIDCSSSIQWHIAGTEELDLKKWYLVIANHQSWLDIVVLQRVFNRKIPVLKFFIKEQLKWIPFLNLAWWAMGCPFMKRYSAAYLEKYPHKKNQDIESIKKAMHAFKQMPASIMNFVEGTRFTALKKQIQNSPYQYLLKPKAGGLSLAIATLGEKISGILDVTITYSNTRHSLWDFLCRRVQAVHVHIRHIAIPERFQSLALLNSAKEQADFREWLNACWAEKDKLIELTKNGSICVKNCY